MDYQGFDSLGFRSATAPISFQEADSLENPDRYQIDPQLMAGLILTLHAVPSLQATTVPAMLGVAS